ncbi:MAG: glycosyltransferase family 39 protein [Nostoc sp.]|uniref:glycosyltransferase family 39 protein n=1 Tax=Nostoc sp. TaxID=1180 RepID=UPI002FF473CF
MNSPIKKYLHIRYNPLQLLVIVLLLLGIFFRFANLDKKIYWHDETYTSLRIAGYTTKEVVQEIFTGQEITIDNVQKYQHINNERKMGETINSLAKEDSQHPPLYYIIARYWVQLFGNSVTVIRSLSAVISLLMFPAVYWLCIELFKSSLTGWIAIALITVSPFQLLYAQEAREYCLWGVTIMLSSAAFLRAIQSQKNQKLYWFIYSFTIALGLYVYPLTALVAIEHGIYLIAIERLRFTKRFIAYILAFIGGHLPFLPWLFVMQQNQIKGLAWTSEEVSKFSLIKTWVGNISRVFIDFNLDSNAPLILAIPITLFTLIIVGYSIYLLYRNTPQEIWLFIFILIGANALLLILPDLIFGGRRSGVNRYLIPCYLFIQLAVAYLFATQLFSVNLLKRKLWQIALVILISCGIVSCSMIASAETWWTKKPSHYHPQTARIINKANSPLLISDNSSFNIGNLISLTYLLEPKVKIQLVTNENIPKIADNFSDVFLLNPSSKLSSEMKKTYHYKIKPVYEPGMLWRLEKNGASTRSPTS